MRTSSIALQSHLLKLVSFVLAATIYLTGRPQAFGTDRPDVLRPENQVAWCIVPFDAKKRSPVQRAKMLKELGILKCAYDWRNEHVPTFEQEILEYQQHGIEFFAFWGEHPTAIQLFEKYDLHPQIWKMIPQPTGETQAAKVEEAAQSMVPLARQSAKLECKLGLYNHGGWSGEPANLVAVCQRLRELGYGHVGIVYNFHHGHGHIDDWSESFAQMQPYLHCLNLNGMSRRAQPKILGIGKGDHELAMIRTVVNGGYQGPIGILDHRNELDAKESLQENMDGLAWVRKEIEVPGSGGPKPQAGVPALQRNTIAAQLDDTFSGQVIPGQAEYRAPPLTVEVRAVLNRFDQYNILVASDTKQSGEHWELFSMKGNGTLTAYLPGYEPDHVRSDTAICDGETHTFSMSFDKRNVQLFVDGRKVADQAVVRVKSRKAVAGDLAIGQLVEGNIGCHGHIEWVRISRGIQTIPDQPLLAVQQTPQTIGMWQFGTEPNETVEQTQTSRPYDAKHVAELAEATLREGNALRGAKVFTNTRLACLQCHRVGDHGGRVGPELTAVAKDRKLSQLIESVLWPKREVKPEYVVWNVATAEGKVVAGYQHEQTAKTLTLRDPASGTLTTISHNEIEEKMPTSTVMPSGLTSSMTRQQQLDLFRFLSELGQGGQPLSSELKLAIQQSLPQGAATFPVSKAPLDPTNWPQAGHPVNRDRIYDFYTKQAEHFRTQAQVPMLLAPFPGLDGGTQGHWGNQNDTVWADDRWNSTKLGSVQSGVLRANGKTISRAVCLQLGENGELSACFNPDTLKYEVLWKDGFLRFDEARHGFIGGLKIKGRAIDVPKFPQVDQPFTYHGFYRHGKRVVFAYRIGDVEYLDAPWAEQGVFIREVAPVAEHSLRDVLQGGPAQWPESLSTSIIPGSGGPYVVDTIQMPTENPWNAQLFCSGHDFLPDGTALVCTMQGDVWRVTGLDSGTDEPGKAVWKRFAAGLHQPLGLVVSEGKVYVQCRDQLVRLSDKNQDGEADFYECFSNVFQTSAAGHDFICGLQRDQDGYFYTVSGNQGLVRISPAGDSAEVIATGFRNPDGLGIYPDGTITIPVSEGTWTPASAVNALQPQEWKQSTTPPYFGFGGPKNNQPPHLPLLYLPRGLDNSSGGQTFVNSDRFGPLSSQMLHFSFGTGTWFALLRDDVGGQLQGAVVPLAGDFLSGAHRGRIRSQDGQLYVSGMAGWGTYTPDDGCFQRVRYTGKAAQLPVEFHVHENGVRVTFADAVDASVATAPHSHFAQCWNYQYSGAYGSPEYSPMHPGVAGHDVLDIQAVHLLPDGRSLFFEIPELQPVNQLHLRMHVNIDETSSCNPSGTGHDMFMSVHRLDEPYKDFQGYTPRKKVIAAHPLLVDLATSASRQRNPFTKKLRDTRSIRIETGKNLTYKTNEFTVRAGESLELTLVNPDVVPHNWVLTKPGTLNVVGQLGNQLIGQPDAYARQYVPDAPQVLAHTDIVPPGTEQTIYFKAPTTPGRYPYLCTFPGHWMVMNGVMIVE